MTKRTHQDIQAVDYEAIRAKLFATNVQMLTQHGKPFALAFVVDCTSPLHGDSFVITPWPSPKLLIPVIAEYANDLDFLLGPPSSIEHGLLSKFVDKKIMIDVYAKPPVLPLAADNIISEDMANAGSEVAVVNDAVDKVHHLQKLGIRPGVLEMIDFLNEVIKLDRGLIGTLVTQRVSCNDAIANHPTIQTFEHTCGILGLLNGFYGAYNSGLNQGWGAIALDMEPDGTPIKFRLLENVVDE